MQIALEISGTDPITSRFVASLMLTAMLVGAWRIGQLFGQLSVDLAAAVFVWLRNRWGW